MNKYGKITNGILKKIEKTPLNANQISKRLNINVKYIRPKLCFLESKGRIRKFSNKKPYQYITSTTKAEMRFLYNIMNKNMNPNKSLNKIDIKRIERIERMMIK